MMCRELGIQIIYGRPDFFRHPSNFLSKFSRFCICLPILVYLNICNLRKWIFYYPLRPWIILRTHMEPPSHAILLDITIPKQGHFPFWPNASLIFQHYLLSWLSRLCTCLRMFLLPMSATSGNYPKGFWPPDHPWIIWGAEWYWRDEMKQFLFWCSDVECHDMGKWVLK